MKNLIYFAVMALFLTSCASYQKQQKKFVKFASDNPSELARLCSDRFPNIPVYLPGKTDTIPGQPIIVRDTVDCPDGTRVPTERTVTPPASTHTRDTIRVPDDAKIFLLNRAISDLMGSVESHNSTIRKHQATILEKDEEINELNNTIKDKNQALLYRLLVIIGLAIVIGIGIVMKIRKII